MNKISSTNPCTIGLIGMGRMGKLLCLYLTRHFKVYVTEKNLSEWNQEILAQKAIPASLEEVCQQDIVIPAVPISQFETVLKLIAPLLKPGSLVIDLCSVKEMPLELMNKILPPSVSILGTHPMFGPDSAANGLKDCKIVLCPLRLDSEKYQEIKNYLKKLQLLLIEASAEDHDYQMAETLILTHFIGRSLMAYGLDDYPIDTLGHRRLQTTLVTVQNDSWQLFQDMIRHNRFAPNMIQRYLTATQEVAKQVGAIE